MMVPFMATSAYRLVALLAFFLCSLAIKRSSSSHGAFVAGFGSEQVVGAWTYSSQRAKGSWKKERRRQGRLVSDRRLHRSYPDTRNPQVRSSGQPRIPLLLATEGIEDGADVGVSASGESTTGGDIITRPCQFNGMYPHAPF